MDAGSTSPITSSGRLVDLGRGLLPGVLLSGVVALAAILAAPVLARAVPIPAMVLALLIGIALNGLASRPAFQPGLDWCVKHVLRVSIALLGLRIALGDIVELGWSTALLVVGAMALTIACGFWMARLLGLSDGYGALAGAATAVCGASAALATATVVPNYPQKRADLAFTVVAANAISTVAMIAYPPLCAWIGLDGEAAGIIFGATIHDMAQVVGAGYAVSEPSGNIAVVVKLFRVLLLLPVVLAIGWWLGRHADRAAGARVPVPMFAVAFLLLCAIGSVAHLVPGLALVFAAVKTPLIQASSLGLLLAIAALGLGTSILAIFRIGWRHAAVFAGTTAALFLMATGGLMIIRSPA